MQTRQCTFCLQTSAVIRSAWYLQGTQCRRCYQKIYKQKNKQKLLESEKVRKRTWKEINPQAWRNQYLKWSFGITTEQYNSLLKSQNSSCFICKTSETGRSRSKYFCVDHDHITGKIRGLLCHDCNTGLGKFKDKPELLLTAFNYLEDSVVGAL